MKENSISKQINQYRFQSLTVVYAKMRRTNRGDHTVPQDSLCSCALSARRPSESTDRLDSFQPTETSSEIDKPDLRSENKQKQTISIILVFAAVIVKLLIPV